MFEEIPLYLIILITTIAIWEIVWKGIALWKTGRNNHLSWFLAIFLFNTAGILPIIYLAFFQKNPDPTQNDKLFDREN
ncbi:MAG: DUF5652 family protein [Bacteroidota bacterium]|nr:DUF5652 family protein [Bacteroidota bacterium]